ncbi:hypothetical protein [Streptosporangium sp. CA-115845]|uniref:hypothetical protein n=1 Tax=Streptosporangium sp. CA-115845 TaxID=3240071 RepID=UPI003D8A613C
MAETLPDFLTFPTFDGARMHLLGLVPRLRPLPCLSSDGSDGHRVELHLDPDTAVVYEVRSEHGDDAAPYATVRLSADDAMYYAFDKMASAVRALHDPSCYLPPDPGDAPLRLVRILDDDLALIDEFNQIYLADLRLRTAQQMQEPHRHGYGRGLDGDVHERLGWALQRALLEVTQLEMAIALQLRNLREAEPQHGSPAGLADRLGVSEAAVRDVLSVDARWRAPAVDS